MWARSCALAIFGTLIFGITHALALTSDRINNAAFGVRKQQSGQAADAFVVKAQVLLSRRNISPGVVDGLDGDNYRKAISQFRRQENLPATDEIDADVWARLDGDNVHDIVHEYEISETDARYDFADSIPHDYVKQAELKRLSYTSPQEMFGERFHMSEKLLSDLNSGKDLSKASTTIFVVNASPAVQKGAGKRIEANKTTGMVLVYEDANKVIASYPATIGSEATPSPSGEYKIEKVVRNPNYTYDPDKNFQQGRNDETLILPPGPNNPVGTVWIALSKPTFGIHGTPEPSKVSKSASHGCVRLTNWDVEQLADLVKPGVMVRFVD